MKSFILYLTIIIYLSSCTSPQKKLPYIGNHITQSKMVDGKEIIDTLYHKVPEFSFMNQDSQMISHNVLNDKVSVVGFIFTSCPTICPVMTKQLVRVQRMTENLKDFLIVTYSVDPERDTPSKLRLFADDYNANTDRWHFLTSDTKTTYDLGMNGYYLGMGKEDDAPGGFIHSPMFLLIDRERHIRGMYDGTNIDEVTNLVKDIKFLHSIK